MKKTILIFLILSGAKPLFAQSIIHTPNIIFKTDTILYLTNGYHVPKQSSVVDLLLAMEGFDIDKNHILYHQGGLVKKIAINGKLYDDLKISKTIYTLPADIVQNIEMIDDYSDAAMGSSMKSAEPDKLLNININIRPDKLPQLRKLFASWHVKVR